MHDTLDILARLLRKFGELKEQKLVLDLDLLPGQCDQVLMA